MSKRLRIRLAVVNSAILAILCSVPLLHAESERPQVLFVCEHGNVKSLMAASYFNQLAQASGLKIQAVSRGSAPDSDAVPAPIVERLRRDGINVSGFHPLAVTAADVSTSQHVVTIGTVLPSSIAAKSSASEQWNDVPAASTDFSAARASLKAHVAELFEQLSRAAK